LIHNRTTRLAGRLYVAACWVAAFVFCLATYELTNDQFGRISPGWQLAKFGDVPFRDFLDPGYFLTELTTAALQRLLGEQLLGEMLLNAIFIATGAVLVLRLSSRASGSATIGLTAAVLALLSMPRAYDYDKVLLYPLGVFLCWRYVDSPSLRNLLWLGVGVAIAGLFRYDNGVFIACAAAVGLIVVHARDQRLLTRRLGLLVAAAACVAAPFLLWIEWHSGLVDAVDQMWTYARREGARTRIESRPAFAIGDLMVIEPRQPAGPIQITWSAAVGVSARRTLADRYQLLDETPYGPPESRTWSYNVADPSSRNLRRLIDDPFVEQTRFIDRDTSTLSIPEPLWNTVMRTVPLARARFFTGLRDRRNGSAFLYHVLTWLPVVAALILVLHLRSTDDDAHLERARVGALLTLCLALNIFILRDPIGARIGGMAGPVAVLGAWIAGQLTRAQPLRRGGEPTRWSAAARVRPWAGRVAVVLLLACVMASLSGVAEWNRRLMFDESVVSRVRRLVTVMAATPPQITTNPNANLWGLVAYLRECTGPADRVFAASFLPELYFFAQRGFAGGVVATFGAHWSEPRFERRMVDALSSQSVPIIVVEPGDLQSFAATYPAIDQYLRQHYAKAGESTSDAPDARPYQVYARRDRAPVGIHARSMLPCFVE
jgi:hypothetical protein